MRDETPKEKIDREFKDVHCHVTVLWLVETLSDRFPQELDYIYQRASECVQLDQFERSA